MSPQGGEATVDVLSGREAVIPAVDGAPDAPLRIETRFRLHRWRDLLPFLWDAIGLVVAFRSSAGAHVMWLKGKPWRLEFGSYSEWKDEGSMRRYVGGSGHRTALI